jgi:nucleoside-diphosphate-sugar epimerase
LKIFIFGLGYVGQALGLSLLANGWQVSGTTRDLEKATLLKKKGFNVYLFSDPLISEVLQNYSHVLVTIPPELDNDPVLLSYASSLEKSSWIGYLSATSVYGDHQGQWVVETSPLNPQTISGIQRMKAEEQWLSTALPVHIFRLSGIYGPSRSIVDSLKRNEVHQRLDTPGHFFSRIHIEDICQVLKASINNPTPREIYNVTDDWPAPTREVIEYACDLLKLALPHLVPFELADLTPRLREFYQDNKRVDNFKMKAQLNVVLRFPTYRAGLKELLK